MTGAVTVSTSFAIASRSPPGPVVDFADPGLLERKLIAQFKAAGLV